MHSRIVPRILFCCFTVTGDRARWVGAAEAETLAVGDPTQTAQPKTAFPRRLSSSARISFAFCSVTS